MQGGGGAMSPPQQQQQQQQGKKQLTALPNSARSSDRSGKKSKKGGR